MPPPPMLHLSVREVTSVSATFILSSRLDSSTDPPLSSFGITENSEDDNSDVISVSATVTTSFKKQIPSRETPLSSTPTDSVPSVIADVLSKGLSVTVNGSAWPRTFIRIDDQTDEAVIIIYALMPGRQYDIQLGLAACQNGQNDQQQQMIQQQEQAIGVRSQIITQENEINHDPESPTAFENDSPLSSSSSSSSPLSTSSFSSTSPSGVSFIPLPPSQPPPSSTPPPPLTLSERLAQLHQTLTHLTTERDTLVTSLKSLRRESQKADASLRTEIDALKRTFDKNASFELRSRQKMLALQESVKRAQNAARDSEEMTREVQEEIFELTKRNQDKEKDYNVVEEDAGKVRREREDVEDREKKRVEGLRLELNALTNKLERLNGKREKVETVVIPDLEAKVEDIESEIQDAEQEVIKLEKEEQSRLQFELSYFPWASPASSSAQRTTSSTQQHSNSRAHNPRSQSIHTTSLTYHSPPHRSSLKTTSKSLSLSVTGSTSGSTSVNAEQQPQPQPPHASPILSSSTRSSPGGSSSSKINKVSTKSSMPSYSPGAGTNTGGGYNVMVNLDSDPLVVGAGRPSKKSS